MLHELRQCVIDSMTHCKDTTQLEWIGFSWLAGGRHQSHLDGEGNPYVFLSKVVREVEVESEEEESEEEEEEEEGEEDAAKGKSERDDVQEGNGKEKAKAKEDLPKIGLWAENDLNISEVQGVKMWDKEIWAGRL